MGLEPLVLVDGKREATPEATSTPNLRPLSRAGVGRWPDSVQEGSDNLFREACCFPLPASAHRRFSKDSRAARPATLGRCLARGGFATVGYAGVSDFFAFEPFNQ